MPPRRCGGGAVNVSSESTLPLEHQEMLLVEKLRALRLCACNEVKVAAREMELAELRERMRGL